TDLLTAPRLAPGRAAHFRWRCPLCSSPVRLSLPEARCEGQGHAFSQVGGTWRFLSEPATQQYAEFERQYTLVRAAEGWGKPDGPYFRRLPAVADGDPQRHIWRQRAASFQALLEHVLQPVESARQRPLTILDLGAGNCWLAHRLAARGHQVAAVDVRTGELDGLGAHIWYGDGHAGQAAFLPVQAEFDRLPFAGNQADLVVFNASLHYSADYTVTLAESQRTLRSDGLLVVMDSPLYRRQAAGAMMVSEREARFQRVYGFHSDTVPSEHFLTADRLHTLAAAGNLHWRVIALPSAWRCVVREWKARLRGQREPAKFPLIVGAGAPLLYLPRHSPAARRVWWSFRHWRGGLFQRRRQDRLMLERVAGVPILVLPTVFNPKVLHSGEFLARCLNEQRIPPGASVLDMGTGTGIGAVVAAQWARRVVAVDINPAAVRCARMNVLLNHGEERIEVREGDLFAAIGDERFDIVLFNPPFFRGVPQNALDRAWRSVDVVERFAAELVDHLTPGGYALVVLSTVGETPFFLEAFQRSGLTVTHEATHDLINEALLLLRLSAASGQAARAAAAGRGSVPGQDTEGTVGPPRLSDGSRPAFSRDRGRGPDFCAGTEG
ncbi:MAG TPA: methyltransferase domain-containing protein, partial [Chloroflexota bacterium]